MQLYSSESINVEELKRENEDLRTKLKNVSKSLAESEDRYKNLAESANSIILRIDAQGIIKFTNNYTLQFFGYSGGEFIGKHVSLILPSNEISDRDYTRHFGMVLTKPGKDVLVENQNIKKSGELIWISWNNRAIMNADGNISEILAIGNEISERKETDDLVFERELFEKIFNNIPVMITIYDQELKNVRFNQEYINILGWTEEDAAEGKLMEKVYPDKSYRGSVVRYMQSPDSGWKEWRLIAKDGSIIESSWANIHLASGIFIGIGIDIRQRKVVEDKLYKNEERLQIIFNNAAIGIVEIDHNDRYINVNKRICEILGYRDEDLIGKTVSDITAPGDLTLSNELNSKLRRGESKIISYEKQYIKSDGSLLWVHVTVSGIYGSDGNHIKSIGTVEDISERKIAEEKLHEALFQAEEGRNILTALMEHIHIGITIADAPDVRIRMISRYGIDLLYQNNELLTGVNASDNSSSPGAFHSDGMTPVMKDDHPLARATRKGEFVKNEELLVRGKDGTLIPVLCNAAPIFDKQGKIVGGVISWQDIAERRRALEALKESEEKFRSLFENITEGVALHELIYENNKPVNYRIIDANPAFNKYTGIDLKKAVGASATELYNDLPYFKDYCQVATTGEPFKFETFYPGMKRHFIINVISPKKGQFATVFEDITELKNTEAELLRSKEKAEESDRLKSAFLANMSHEIRTPMNGIMGFADLLKTPDLSGESQKSYIEIIEASGKRMLDILNYLIDISRIEAGQIRIKTEPTDIPELLNDLLKFFSREANDKNIELKSNIKLRSNEYVFETDKTILAQILTNLLKNALKFTEKNGYIELGCKTTDQSTIYFYVKDTGSGIRKELHEKIFDRFSQGDITHKHEGVGLGLAISKAYVEMLGGKIGLNSEPGKGSVFFIDLPRLSQSAEAESYRYYHSG